MQSTAVQMKTRDPQSIGKEASSAGKGKGDNSEFADPFLQIIMGLLSQSTAQSTQQPDSALSADRLSQLTELYSLFQSSPTAISAIQSSLLNTSSSTDSEMSDDNAAAISALMNMQAVPASSPEIDLPQPLVNIPSKGEILSAIGDNTIQAAIGNSVARSTIGENTAQAAIGRSVVNSVIPENTVQTAIGSSVVQFAAGENVIQAAIYEQPEQPAEISNMLRLFGKGVDKSGTITISSGALTQMTNLLGLSSKDEAKSLLNTAGIQVITDVSSSAQSGLSEAVVKAKQMLSENDLQQTSNQGDIDIEMLENKLAKTDTSSPFELQLKSIGKSSEAKVLDQVTEGIKQNISVGKSEFVIKLKPEALGEITVKLVEDAGKTTLTITAAKAQTATLINNDLGALRETLASMNVEVRNAVVSTNETSNGSMQQFNMAGQHFNGQQFAGQQHFFQMTQTVSGQTENQTAEDIYESSQASQSTVISNDRLDAYI